MARYLSFGFLFAFIAGCAAPAANLPAPQIAEPQPAAPRPAEPQQINLQIRGPALPGWIQAPAPDGMGNLMLVNEELKAQFMIGVFSRKEGEPRDMVGMFMVKMMAEGAEIGTMDLPYEGSAPASMDFSGASASMGITGRAAAKFSGIDGFGLLVIGLWPTANDAAVRPVFDLVFGTLDIVAQ